MITGIHAIFYSRNADAVRRFLSDALQLRSVDAGDGWPIFAAPPTELGVHPTDEEPEHELYFMCDDIQATVAHLKSKGYVTTPIHERSWGLSTAIELEGGEQIGLYQPQHASPLSQR